VIWIYDALQITTKNMRSFYPKDANNDSGSQSYTRGEGGGGRSQEQGNRGGVCVHTWELVFFQRVDGLQENRQRVDGLQENRQ
jgi:hypothetical protein